MLSHTEMHVQMTFEIRGDNHLACTTTSHYYDKQDDTHRHVWNRHGTDMEQTVKHWSKRRRKQGAERKENRAEETKRKRRSLFWVIPRRVPGT